MVSELISEKRAKKRAAKKRAADSERAAAELGAQHQGQVTTLASELSRRDAFIQRNVLSGPDAYSATPLETRPKNDDDSFYAFAPRRLRPEPDVLSIRSNPTLFVVGSDDESDNEESEPSNQARVGPSPRSLTTVPAVRVPAVRVRPSKIKTINLQLKGVQDKVDEVDEEVDLGTVSRDAKDAPELKKEEEDSGGDNTLESPPGKAPSLGEHSAEVKTTVAEAA
ncbi:hypothetical protein C8A00DRAFT_37300 [Chaetomidium leptoderma]|uniref:Uncharacterized protein n=1 Tax=Chaetomidium leptoderma TaxID=669021 RepID=A0AAN6ZTX3_9PEZI|nr:hypothetical protein C8A00DRAFT_37300 [Chaetomidium leptoderma]